MIDVSASQIETFLDCPRKWAFNKIDKIQDFGGPAAQLGSAIHSILEDWLLNSKPVDMKTREGRAAFSLLKLLPVPNTPGLEIEQWFSFQLGHGQVNVRGRIDWQILSRDVPLVGDHKTTSDLVWAKSEDTLMNDIQAACYAMHAHLKTGKPDIALEWNYVDTSKFYTKRVSVTMPAERAKSIVNGRVLAPALSMISMKQKYSRAIEYPCNVESCDKYGGCAFRDKCGIKDADKGASMKSFFSDFKERIHAVEGIVTTETVTTETPQTETPQTETPKTETPENNMSLKSIAIFMKRREDYAGVPAASAPAPAPAPVAAPAPTPVKLPVIQRVNAGDTVPELVSGPSAPVAPPPPVVAKEVPEGKKERIRKLYTKKKVAEQGSFLGEPPVEQPVVEQPVVEQPAAVEPVVEQPAAVEPVVVEPVVEKPAVVEKPVVEQPAVVEKPVASTGPLPTGGLEYRLPTAEAELEATIERVMQRLAYRFLENLFRK